MPDPSALLGAGGRSRAPRAGARSLASEGQAPPGPARAQEEPASMTQPRGAEEALFPKPAVRFGASVADPFRTHAPLRRFHPRRARLAGEPRRPRRDAAPAAGPRAQRPLLAAHLHRGRHPQRPDPRQRASRRGVRDDALSARPLAARARASHRVGQAPLLDHPPAARDRTALRPDRRGRARARALAPGHLERDAARRRPQRALPARPGRQVPRRPDPLRPVARRTSSRCSSSEGVPRELVALPHVESSFNPRAYSHVGAAGLWQFMRSTGRRYMRVDDVVDERMDPHKASVAAARLLGFNYRQIDSWPLAITAYNHGAGRDVARGAHARHPRHRGDRLALPEPQLRLRVAQLLRRVPGRLRDRPRSRTASSARW